MDYDWIRLGRLIAERRQRIGWSQEQLVARTRLSRSTVQRLERGDGFGRVAGSAHRVAACLGWASGSVEAILAGGDPTLLDGESTQTANAPGSEPLPPGVVADSFVDKLPLGVVVLLEHGVVVEHTVASLSPGLSVIAVAVRHGDQRTTPQTRRAEAAQWEAIRTGIHQHSDADASP